MTQLPFWSAADGAGRRRGPGARCCVHAGEAGQNIVEFALVLPLLVLVLIGIAEFGRGINAFVTLSEAAREGARAGIYVSATDDQIRQAVRSQAMALGTLPDSAIVISPAYPRQSGDELTVQVTYQFMPATPLLESMLPGGGLTLKGQATMRVE